MKEKLSLKLIRSEEDLKEATIGEDIFFVKDHRKERVCYNQNNQVCTLRIMPGREKYGEICLYEGSLNPTLYIGGSQNEKEEISIKEENLMLRKIANFLDISSVGLIQGIKECERDTKR